MNKKCSGCGSIFQSLNKDSSGYINPSKKNDATYCERCFKIMHYGESLVVLAPSEIKKIIDEVNDSHQHVLFVCDLLSLNSDIINIYQKINCTKTLIINKYDLFKHLLKENKIKEYLKDNYDIQENILFISSINNHNVKDLLNYLDKFDIHKAYLVGFINAGKSTLINTILKMRDQSILGLTTSYIPHTTMNFIEMKISDNLTLIDSPGFSYSSFLSNDLNLLKKIDIKKKIKPITYQMKQNESLIIEDLVDIAFLDKANITIYLSNKFKIKKDYKINRYYLKLLVPKDHDLVIKGIGFICFKTEVEIEINIEDKNLIELRKSFFGGVK